MAKQLKGVIIGITNVMHDETTGDTPHFDEVERLIQFLRFRNITPVIFGNRNWSVDGTPIKQYLAQRWPNIDCIIASEDGTPFKQTRDASTYLLQRYNWDPSEVVSLGNTAPDMQFAINGNMMFLNATWYGQNNEYGIKFASPLDVGRFLDTFCLREHLWHYTIEDGNFRYYALGPYSTRINAYQYFSSDARLTAKSAWGAGHPDFWTRYLYSTIYFSELHKEVKWLASYPSSTQGAGNVVVEEPLLTFSKCFYNTKYLRDLIIRHTGSIKSSTARTNGTYIDHDNQLNTISLNKAPLRTDAQRYKAWPIKEGDTVLVIDDICTNGYSLEAARAYLKQLEVNVICMSWLKTINSNYNRIVRIPKFVPFGANSFSQNYRTISYPYRDHIVDASAPEEIDAKLRAYDNWQWPAIPMLVVGP